MTKNYVFSIFFLLPLFISAQVGIGTDDPHPSAEFEVNSNAKGVLLPKLTYTEMTNISNPAESLLVFCSSCDTKTFYYYNGDEWVSIIDNSEAEPIVHEETGTVIEEVTSPTGQVWMDRNLGASRVATSPDDVEAQGFLYQWGRKNDGHQFRNSSTQTSRIATTSSNPNFITGTVIWYNSGSPGSLWDGANASNNPCPDGFRVPAESELIAETNEFNSNSNNGFHDTPLKFVRTGQRAYQNGSIGANQGGTYWTSEISFGGNARSVRFTNLSTTIFTDNAQIAQGRAVRCIKD